MNKETCEMIAELLHRYGVFEDKSPVTWNLYLKRFGSCDDKLFYKAFEWAIIFHQFLPTPKELEQKMNEKQSEEV